MYSTEVTEKYMIWNEPNINVQPMLYLYNLGGHWVHFLNSYIIRSLSKYTYMDCWVNQLSNTFFATWRFCPHIDLRNPSLFLFPLHPGVFWPAATRHVQKRTPSWRCVGLHLFPSIYGGLYDHVTNQKCHSKKEFKNTMQIHVFI